MDSVIFDMDGVIIDTEPVYLALYEKFYKELGIEVADSVSLSSTGCDSEEWWQFIVDQFGIKNVTAKEIASKERQRMLEFLTEKDIEKPFFDETVEAVKKLKEMGYKTAVASSSSKELVDNVLLQAGLTDYFDAVVSGTDKEVKQPKPAPDIFLYAASLIRSTPEKCIVIEDGVRGITAAKAAGMQCAAFLSSPVKIDTSEADLEFRDYSVFFNYLNNLKKASDAV